MDSTSMCLAHTPCTHLQPLPHAQPGSSEVASLCQHHGSMMSKPWLGARGVHPLVCQHYTRSRHKPLVTCDSHYYTSTNTTAYSVWAITELWPGQISIWRKLYEPAILIIPVCSIAWFFHLTCLSHNMADGSMLCTVFPWREWERVYVLWQALISTSFEWTMTRHIKHRECAQGNG